MLNIYFDKVSLKITLHIVAKESAWNYNIFLEISAFEGWLPVTN